MNDTIAAALFALMLAATGGSALAAEATAQQSKMGSCNKEAGEMKGDERKAFMKTCLSAKPAQQTKMATCNKDAGEMKGDARKAFMKDCLSAKKAA